MPDAMGVGRFPAMKGALGVVATLVLAISISACGSSESQSEEVDLPAELTAKSQFLDVYREYLDDLPVADKVARCYLRNMEDRPDNFFERNLAKAEDGDTQEMIEFSNELAEICVEPGDPVVDPNATDEQIDALRSEISDSMPLILQQSSGTDSEIECVAEAARDLSDEEVVAFTSTPRQTRKIMTRMTSGCRGQ